MESIERFRALEAKNPELAEEVFQGEKSLHQARTELSNKPKRKARMKIYLDDLIEAVNRGQAGCGRIEIEGLTFFVAVSEEKQEELRCACKAAGWPDLLANEHVDGDGLLWHRSADRAECAGDL